MRRLAVAGCALVLCFALGLGACAAVVAAAAGSGATGSGTPGAPPAAAAAVGPAPGSPRGAPAVPPAREAAATCRGLMWSVLGAIGRVESDSGRFALAGVAAGANPAGAEVTYRREGGPWHLRNEATGGRGSLVSDGPLARGQGGGHSGFIGSPAHHDRTTSVASGVSI